MKTLLILVLLLSACTTDRIVYRDVPYEVQKVVYCAEDVEEVEYETSNMKKSDSTSLKVNLLLVERQQRIKVESKLRAELRGCQDPVANNINPNNSPTN